MRIPRSGSGQVNLNSGLMQGPEFLKHYLSVPGRPGASIRLWFDHESQSVMATITEREQVSSIFRIVGETLEFGMAALGWFRVEKLPEWARVGSETSSFCLLAFRASGEFCGRQAYTDWTKHKNDPFWFEVLDDAKHMYHAAIVMLR